jgi:hypothetical protein
MVLMMIEAAILKKRIVTNWTPHILLRSLFLHSLQEAAHSLQEAAHSLQEAAQSIQEASHRVSWEGKNQAI